MRFFNRGLKHLMGVAAGVLLVGAHLSGGSSSALADKNSKAFDNTHDSILKVERVAPGGENRTVKIGLNKSLVVELPRDVRDVVVSNPEFLDAVLHSSRRAYLIGKKLGEGNAFFFDKQGNRILTVEVSISRDLSAVGSMLRRVLPGSKVKVETVNEHIVLTGSVRSPADATKAADIAARFVKSKEEVINLLQTGASEQVYLKVRVVEVQRTVAKQLGVDVGALLQGNSLTFNVLSDIAFGASSLVNPTSATLTHTNGNDTISGKLKALETNGLLRTLAEPNLTAISGETANFLAGGEFPIPVAQDGNEISIEFKPFGVGLAFTPIVLDENRISLKIATEVSELTTDNQIKLSSITIPAIKVRRASTTVELATGGSIVMAGLISDEAKHNISDVPELKRLPVLGALFRSRDFVRDETELVIIVTPYLVNQTAEHKLKTPDQGLGIPSDRKAFLKGHLTRNDRRKRRVRTDVPADWSSKDSRQEVYQRPSGNRVRQKYGQPEDREFRFIVE